jgi:5'-phosphate synthase pdxT subunit
MTMLMERMGLYDAVRDALQAGLPTLGTCAGMILLAERISDGIDGQQGFGVLDIAVRRNAYGRQLESFEAPLELAGEVEDFPGVFIRAPIVEDTGSTEVIARHQGRPVGVRKGRTMALAFHPELSGDLRLHREFLRLVRS